MVITDFRDGVLIKADYQNFVITPKNPKSFTDTIQKRKT